MKKAVRLLLIAALAASPFVMHAALTRERLLFAAALAGALQGFAAGSALPVPHARYGAAALAIVLGACIFTFPGVALLAWPGILNATIYGALLARFARSLAPGHMPVVSWMAAMVRGPLPPEVARYTRRVTIAWCVFFAGQLAMSGLLLASVPLSQWVWFVTLCNLPLVLTMFVAESGVRRIMLRDHRHTSITGTIAAIRAGLARGGTT